MKFANKLMVVPFVNKIENPTEKYLVDLDDQMSSILLQKNVSIDEKVKLYSQALQKYLVNYDNKYTGSKTIPPDNAEMINEIKEEFAKIKNEPIENFQEIIQEIKKNNKDSIEKADILSNLNEIKKEINLKNTEANDQTNILEHLKQIKKDINIINDEDLLPKKKRKKNNTTIRQFNQSFVPETNPIPESFQNMSKANESLMDTDLTPVKNITTRLNSTNIISPDLNYTPDRIANFEKFKKEVQSKKISSKDQETARKYLDINIDKNIKKVNEYANLKKNLVNSTNQEYAREKLNKLTNEKNYYHNLINQNGKGLFQKGGCKWISKKFF